MFLTAARKSATMLANCLFVGSNKANLEMVLSLYSLDQYLISSRPKLSSAKAS